MIPMNDLKRAFAEDAVELTATIEDVAGSGWYIGGTHVRSFEKEFAAYLGVAECIGVGNGTDALEIALRAVGVTAGSLVATVANAGFYTSTACLVIGAAPVYVDIEPGSLQVSIAGLEQALSDGVAAVVLTHLFGDCSAAPIVAELCRAAGVPLVEDCAQAAGARADGKSAGSFGDVAAFSFFPTKNLGALGDAGALATSSPQIADAGRLLSQYGWVTRYQSIRAGRNSRLDEIQAAVLRHRLPLLENANARRRAIATRYHEALEGTTWRLVFRDAESHVAHLAVVVASEAPAARAYLRDRGIATDIHYPILDHRQPLWTGHESLGRGLLESERIQPQIFSIPCFPQMTDAEVAQVALELTQAARTVGRAA